MIWNYFAELFDQNFSSQQKSGVMNFKEALLLWKTKISGYALFSLFIWFVCILLAYFLCSLLFQRLHILPHLYLYHNLYHVHMSHIIMFHTSHPTVFHNIHWHYKQCSLQLVQFYTTLWMLNNTIQQFRSCFVLKLFIIQTMASMNYNTVYVVSKMHLFSVCVCHSVLH